MAGGLKVIRQTIDREDALIAYTRKNAYFVFQENNLGSIQPGKLADLVVLDRDYLTVPADQIKDLKPVMTVVGGKIVRRRARAQAAGSCTVNSQVHHRSQGCQFGSWELAIGIGSWQTRLPMTWRVLGLMAGWCIVAGAWTNAQAPAARNPFEGDRRRSGAAWGCFARGARIAMA